MSPRYRALCFGIAVGGIVAVALTNNPQLGVVVAAINALLPSVLGKKSDS